MNSEHKPYITTGFGMRGYYAVYVAWNEDHGGFYEPWTTSDETFKNHAAAAKYAEAWAKDEGMEYCA